MEKWQDMPMKIQARLSDEERKEFYEAWKELEPDIEWAAFCRKMMKKGVILERIDQENIIRGRKQILFPENPENGMIAADDTSQYITSRVEKKETLQKSGNQADNIKKVNNNK